MSESLADYNINAEGEIIEEVTPELSRAIELYKNVAIAPFSPKAVELLLAPIDPATVSIRPDGIVYFEQNGYRRLLNKAFGPGAWALVPVHIGINRDDNLVTYEGALFVLGRFVSQAIGEHRYQPKNDNSSYATSAESAKSDCLTRCCKDLGIASELWDKEFVERWRATHAVQVWCINVGTGDGKGKKKPFWRKRSAPPIDQFPWKEDSKGQTYSGGMDRTPEEIRAAPAPADDSGETITPEQLERFCTIATAHGWTEEEQHKLIAKWYVSRKDIRRNDYGRLCEMLQDTAIHARAKAALYKERLEVDPLGIGEDRTQGAEDDAPEDVVTELALHTTTKPQLSEAHT